MAAEPCGTHRWVTEVKLIIAQSPFTTGMWGPLTEDPYALQKEVFCWMCGAKP